MFQSRACAFVIPFFDPTCIPTAIIFWPRSVLLSEILTSKLNQAGFVVLHAPKSGCSRISQRTQCYTVPWKHLLCFPINNTNTSMVPSYYLSTSLITVSNNETTSTYWCISHPHSCQMVTARELQLQLPLWKPVSTPPFILYPVPLLCCISLASVQIHPMHTTRKALKSPSFESPTTLF